MFDLPHGNECCDYRDVITMNKSEPTIKKPKRKICNLEFTPSLTLVVNDTDSLLHLLGGSIDQEMPQRVVYIAEVLANLTS